MALPLTGGGGRRFIRRRAPGWVIWGRIGRDLDWTWPAVEARIPTSGCCWGVRLGFSCLRQGQPGPDATNAAISSRLTWTYNGWPTMPNLEPGA